MIDTSTTVPHLVLEKFPHIATAIEIPADIKGDIEKEHKYLFPILMRDHRTEWEIICEEVDKAIEQGCMFFNGEDGTITLTVWNEKITMFIKIKSVTFASIVYNINITN